MAHRPFASATLRGGQAARRPQPSRAHSGGRIARARWSSHDWINAEYKHLIIDASPKALAVKPGQFFNMLCPSPDDGELWLRRPQSVYRIDRAQRPPRVPLQMRRPRHARPGDPRARRRAQHGRPAGRRLLLRARLEEHRRARPRRRPRHHGADLAARRARTASRVTAILSARSPEFVMADDLFAEGRRGDPRARHRRHQRGRERRDDPASA